MSILHVNLACQSCILHVNLPCQSALSILQLVLGGCHPPPPLALVLSSKGSTSKESELNLERIRARALPSPRLAVDRKEYTGLLRRALMGLRARSRASARVKPSERATQRACVSVHKCKLDLTQASKCVRSRPIHVYTSLCVRISRRMHVYSSLCARACFVYVCNTASCKCAILCLHVHIKCASHAPTLIHSCSFIGC